MMRIAITPWEILPDEPQQIVNLLESGWSYVHLRHPDATFRDVRNIIESIPQQYHSRLKLHGHFELVHSFNLGGLHLNSRCPNPPAGYSGKLTVSCHTPGELHNCSTEEYATLSPIYPSISKPGYGPTLTRNEIMEAVAASPVPVIALGGVSPHKEQDLQNMGFAGYACMGAAWNCPSNIRKQ